MIDRPATLEEALALRAAGPVRPLAGGTDLYPAEAAAAAWLRPSASRLLDLSGIAGLDRIEQDADGWRIGACVTWAALRDAALPPAFAGLQAAAATVGGVQVQNRGTVLGNLCNASPAADGAPPLLALEAGIDLASPRGVRRLALADFLLGNRRTALAHDELAIALHVPTPPTGARGSFQKLGARSHLVISIAMVAVLAAVRDGQVTAARLAVGACGPVAQRLPVAEAALIGAPLAQAPGLLLPAHLAALTPLDDLRGSAAYRRQAALVLLRRALAAALA
jgi:CO/xanthine dehydrogenase FAD-binding subunit